MTDILDDSYESDLTEEESEQLLLRSEHAVAPPLSPSARKVFEAFNSKFDWIEDGVPGPQFNAIAAALTAATDQVVPLPHDSCCDVHIAFIRAELLALANELESQ